MNLKIYFCLFLFSTAMQALADEPSIPKQYQPGGLFEATPKEIEEFLNLQGLANDVITTPRTNADGFFSVGPDGRRTLSFDPRFSDTMDHEIRHAMGASQGIWTATPDEEVRVLEAQFANPRSKARMRNPQFERAYLEYNYELIRKRNAGLPIPQTGSEEYLSGFYQSRAYHNYERLVGTSTPCPPQKIPTTITESPPATSPPRGTPQGTGGKNSITLGGGVKGFGKIALAGTGVALDVYSVGYAGPRSGGMDVAQAINGPMGPVPGFLFSMYSNPILVTSELSGGTSLSEGYLNDRIRQSYLTEAAQIARAGIRTGNQLNQFCQDLINAGAIRTLQKAEEFMRTHPECNYYWR